MRPPPRHPGTARRPRRPVDRSDARAAFDGLECEANAMTPGPPPCRLDDRRDGSLPGAALAWARRLAGGVIGIRAATRA